jgi:hypothetical protein
MSRRENICGTMGPKRRKQPVLVADLQSKLFQPYYKLAPLNMLYPRLVSRPRSTTQMSLSSEHDCHPSADLQRAPQADR